MSSRARSAPLSALRKELGRLRSSALARNAGWMVCGQGGGFLFQSAYFILIARLLGPSQYGVFAGAFALTGILGQYSAMGTGTLFLRYVGAEPAKFALYWGNILVMTAACGATAIAALSLFAGRLLGPGTGWIVLMAAIANCLCNQLTSCAASVFQSFEQMRVAAALNLAANFARALAAAAMLAAMRRATAGQWATAAAAVSALAAGAAIATVSAKFGKPAFSLALMRRHFAEGFGFAFATSTSTAYNDLDKAMLSHYGMNAANGIYTMAYRIVDVAAIPGLAIREAALPRFFRSGRAGIQEAAALALRLLKRAVPLGLVAAAVIFLGAPIVPHLVGSSFRESVAALRWLFLIPVFRAFHHMTGSALTGSGLQRYRTLAQSAAVALNIGLNLWLIPHHGWLGAAWSGLLSDSSLAAMNCAALALLRQTRSTEPVSA